MNELMTPFAQFYIGFQALRGSLFKETDMNKAEKSLKSRWSCMKRRCYCEGDANYHNYGGRGIKVCKEWREDFMSFYNWAVRNGYENNKKRGECTLDRIDVNGNYEPSNCRWVDMKTQARNTRKNRYIEYKGIKHVAAELCEKLNINPYLVYKRLERGWSVEEAVEKRVDREKQLYKSYNQEERLYRFCKSAISNGYKDGLSAYLMNIYNKNVINK